MASSRLLLRFALSGTLKQSILKPNISGINASLMVVNRRFVSEKVLEGEQDKQVSWLEWLSDPFFRHVKPKEIKYSEEMLKERQELLSRIQALYYKKPPEEPGKEFYIEAIEMLMRQGDLDNVEVMWTLAERQKIYFEDDFIDKVEDFMLEEKEKQWYES